MAETPQSQETRGAGQTSPGTGWPQGLFGSSTTILLIVFAVAVFWWSRRRRVEMEEQMRAQRREAEAVAERSALDVAHLMRSAQRSGTGTAAREERSSLVKTSSSGTGEPRAAAMVDDGADVAAATADLERPPTVSGHEDALGREIERQEARAAADRAAEEQAELASRSTEPRGASTARRKAVPNEPAVDATLTAQMRSTAGAGGGGGADLEAAVDARDVIPEQSAGAAVPPGAIPGDGTAICPPGYPIKGNRQSHIYHRPGQVSYASTVAEYCFASGEAAEAAGYRPSRARDQRGQSG